MLNPVKLPLPLVKSLVMISVRVFAAQLLTTPSTNVVGDDATLARIRTPGEYDNPYSFITNVAVPGTISDAVELLVPEIFGPGAPYGAATTTADGSICVPPLTTAGPRMTVERLVIMAG